MFDNLKADTQRYRKQENWGRWFTVRELLQFVSTKASWWAIVHYRFGRWVRTKGKIAYYPLNFIYRIWQMVVLFSLGIYIDPEAKIGKGFYIGHFGAIWVGPLTIGENCSISIGNVLGTGAQGKNKGIPVIGSDVYIGPGAVVFGNIRIGDKVEIGSNSVVSKSLPDGAVVVGNPGRIVSIKDCSKPSDICGYDNE